MMVLKCDKIFFLISSYEHDQFYICLNALKVGWEQLTLIQSDISSIDIALYL